VLARESFVDILGPLYSLMAREKSPAVVTQRLMKLQTKVGSPLALLCHPQQPA
jgi:cGMP-dependent protein kinase 2